MLRVGARPIEVPGVNAALLARLESQIITSISDNGRVINTGLVSPTPPGLRRLIQADGRALKGVMDNSLNSQMPHNLGVKAELAPWGLRLCPDCVSPPQQSRAAPRERGGEWGSPSPARRRGD